MSIPMPNLGLIWIVFGLTMAGCDAPVKPILEPDGRYCSPGLLKAVMAGDVSQIHWLASNGVEVNCARRADEFLTTPLILAVRSNHAEAVKELLAMGADVFFNEGVPLSEAVSVHNVAIERLLLDAGADPNRRATEVGNLPLAFLWHDAPSAQLLLDYGADADLQWKGHTTLIAATVAGDTAFVKLLLDAGAGAALRDAEGHTALDYAKQRGNGEIIALLTRRTVP
jgi:ankyrin repeat protein